MEYLGIYKHVEFDEESQCILITYRGNVEYDVPLSRCKTAGQVLDWIHQLHVKTWFTPEMEYEFIDLLLKLIPSNLWSGGGE